jgi:ectoine hydroxylase-related dioxygenase (phytanoyl-CoA dioxygenase family)
VRTRGTLDISSLRHSIDEDGFAIIKCCLEEDTLLQLAEIFGDSTHAQRNLLDVPAVFQLAHTGVVRDVMAGLLGRDCRAVKGIFFNKTQEANWKVAWHQDLTITVRQRIEYPGFGPWTKKDGVQNVQPPAEILDQVLAIRIHLDQNTLENGPLRVIPGSHRFGRLSAEQIATWDKSTIVTCTVPRGGAVLVRPLLLHSSSACISPTARRVVHLEFTAAKLPCGLQWQSNV